MCIYLSTALFIEHITRLIESVTLLMVKETLLMEHKTLLMGNMFSLMPNVQRDIAAIVSNFGEIKQNEHFLATIEECVVSHIGRRSYVTLLSSPATAASLDLFTLDHTATRCNTQQHTAQKHTEHIFNLNRNSTLPLWLNLSA